jgi:hypothetical protein
MDIIRAVWCSRLVLCKNGLSDKIDSLDIFVTTPNNYRAASNGILISEIELLNSQKNIIGVTDIQ